MLKMSSLRVTVKRSRGKKQQKETEKQQHVIVTENNLFKGFTTEGVRNYDQKYSGKLDSGFSWNCSRCGRFIDSRFGTPSTVTVKLAGLFSEIIRWYCKCYKKRMSYFPNNNNHFFLAQIEVFISYKIHDNNKFKIH